MATYIPLKFPNAAAKAAWENYKQAEKVWEMAKKIENDSWHQMHNAYHEYCVLADHPIMPDDIHS